MRKLSILVLLLVLGSICSAQTCTISVSPDGSASLSHCSPSGDGTLTFAAAPPPPPITPDNIYSSPTNQWTGPLTVGSAIAPTSTINTMTYLTPSPGSSRPATPATFAATLAASACGDIIQLSPGIYNLSSVVKSCDALHWLTIVGPSLSAEGTRTSPANFLSSALFYPPKASAISFLGSSFIRLEGIEPTRPVGAGAYFALFDMAGAHDIIIDRVYWHGSPSPTDETRHGIMLNNSYNIAVIDSYSADFKCLAGIGSCTDSQAISGGNNSVTTQTGNYKIVNNRIEAAAEGIILGGGPSSSTSCDMEIRLNLFTKNLSWMPPVKPTTTSGSPIVKNNLEFKNACRAFVEENIFENVWGGFSQVGYQVLLSPKNPQGTAPTAQVHDIILRSNWMRHSGGCLQLTATKADASATSPATSSLGLWNIAVDNLVCEDVESGSTMYGAGGTMFQVTRTDAAAKFDSLSLDRITAVKGSKLIVNVGSIKYVSNLSWTNSILDVGTTPTCGTASCQVHGTGSGTTDCSYNLSTPISLFNSCWQPYSFTNNVILGGWGSWPNSTLLTTVTAASFVDYAGGDYHLKSTSPFINQGQGADIDLASKALSHLN